MYTYVSLYPSSLCVFLIILISDVNFEENISILVMIMVGEFQVVGV